MNAKISVKELFRSASRTFEYALEGAILMFTESLVKQMEAQELSNAALAERLDCKPSYITKLLNGFPNLTLGSMVKIAQAVGCEIAVEIKPVAASDQANVVPMGSAVWNAAIPTKSISAGESNPRAIVAPQMTLPLAQEMIDRTFNAANEELALAA